MCSLPSKWQQSRVSLHWVNAQGVSPHKPANSFQPTTVGYQNRHLATYFPKQSICPFRGNGANVRLYHSYVQNDLGISMHSNNWCMSFKHKRGKYNCKSIQVSSLVFVTAITKTKSPSEWTEFAITSLRAGLLIFCSVWTCLLALQVSELGYQLKNAPTKTRMRTLLHICHHSLP